MELSEIKVIKRDGREVSFDITKVQNALYKAFEEVGPWFNIRLLYKDMIILYTLPLSEVKSAT